jgi:hypothetical protein
MRTFVLSLLLLPLFASAQGISRVKPYDEELLWSWSPQTAAAGGSNQAGRVLVNRGARVTAVEIYVSTGGGGGAGSTVYTITDGTNTCTASFLCTVTAVAGSYRATAANGAGTGCSYAPGATLTASITTGTCTTTQPTIRLFSVQAKR